MNSDLKALYEKYQITTASLFDEGSQFSVLLSQIEGGHNEYTHFSRKLEKIIDIKWVDAIEECIIPLDTIIRNPRRFIVQEEEIVPIERAKKISSESIRHLAQHTNMINSVTKDGMVTPNRILNVFREESFDIYENRFIYTLLINVKNFIEKRYAVIFKLSGDENVDVVKMNSKVKFGKEEITYDLQLDAKKINSMDVDEDSDVLARIERIRRIIDEFLSSPFAAELSGCALVRPPITRTNLITKDPNFKQCLDLWIFVESYNEVGYEINLEEKNEPINEEYINELNRLMAFNYMMLKNNINDPFALDGVKPKKRKLKPKFIKNFIEELVNDYDVTDDEIRRIFVDQINKYSNRRKAEEDKIDKAIARCLDAEDARKAEILVKIREEAKRIAEIQRRKEERARIARERAEAKEKARIEREAARKKAAEEREREAARKARERQKAREKAARERAIVLEKERLAKEKAKAKEKAARERAIALEKERLAKEKAKAKEKAARERAIALEKERLAKEKAKAKEKAAREKAAALEKERLAKEKAKAKEKAAREKAAALEKERLAKEKAKAKEKAAREKAAALEKERIAKAKAKAKEKAAREREKAKAKANKG